MRVDRLYSKNFRCFRKLSVQFPSSNIAVLIGINETGKTSILDCIAALLSQFSTKLCKKSSREIEFSLTENDIKVDSPSTCARIRVHDDARTVSWQIAKSFSFQNKGEEKSNYKELNQYVSDLHEKLSYDPNLDLPIVAYYKTNRGLPENSSKRSNGSQRKYAASQFYAYEDALERQGNDFHEFVSWFKVEEDWENQQKIDHGLDFENRSLQVIRNATQTFFSKLSSNKCSNLRVKRIKRDGTYNYGSYNVQHKSELIITCNGQDLKISQLSDGRQRLLLMVADLAFRLAVANLSGNPLNGEGIVLIDEIDLHLHPRWQREVLPSLRETFPNIQFIATTHSPLIVSSVDAQEMLKISEHEGSLIVKPEPISFKNWKIEFILRDVMDLLEGGYDDSEKLLSQLSDAIKNNDLEKYEKLMEQLKLLLHPDDPILMRCKLARTELTLNRKMGHDKDKA